jgi:cysteinyl-tRNA synthetase
MLMTHYRSKLSFSEESLTAARNALNNLRADIAELPAIDPAATEQQPWSPEAHKLHEAFHEAINNDLDLPIALSITREAARTSKIEPLERHRLVLDFDRVLGLRLNEVAPKAPVVLSDEVLELVRQRDAARAARNWRESDRIREELKAMGFEVRDTPKGTQLV